MSPEFFNNLIHDKFGALLDVPAIAVGVSGGPDSMALLWLLSRWARDKGKDGGGIEIYALTVDHGLRPEAAAEALQVQGWVKDWPCVTARILTLDAADIPSARIMENARNARYEVFQGACRDNNIRSIFLAHHQDDQAETFLLRLAGGSGLNGLSCMRSVQVLGDNALNLARPFLEIPKADLLNLCAAQNIPYVQDPSNMLEKYARPRLRKSWGVLEGEGLSAKRLSVTAWRLNRAREALDKISMQSVSDVAILMNSSRIEYDLKLWRALPDEIALRALIKAIEYLRGGAGYLPRMERIEDVFESLRGDETFKKRTLGGLIFARDDKKSLLKIIPEVKKE